MSGYHIVVFATVAGVTINLVSTFIFQSSVITVGDAVNQVLLTTGYQLAPNLSHDVKNTLRQPLPFIDRKLGPMPAQSALLVLMGESVYQLQEDCLHRVVNFQLKTLNNYTKI